MVKSKFPDLQIVKKEVVSLQESLLNMPSGKKFFVNYKVVKPGSMRATVSALNKMGYSFEITERNIPDGVLVFRKENEIKKSKIA